MGAKMGAKVGTKLESVIGFCIQCFRMIKNDEVMSKLHRFDYIGV